MDHAYVVLKKPCRHGRTEPHNVDFNAADTEAAVRWCADGDSRRLELSEVAEILRHALDGPSVWQGGADRADQLVAALFDAMRGKEVTI